MDRTPKRTPKRKRRRHPATPGSADSATAEATIVWKDSPVEKQIRVSGTGKMAVRREVQGFVGRLARASEESPPVEVSAPAPGELLLKRVGASATGTSQLSARRRDHMEGTSRHLLFSPDANTRSPTSRTPPRPPSHQKAGGKPSNSASLPEGSDSQDALYSMLDQMEEKYASEDGSDPLKRFASPPPNANRTPERSAQSAPPTPAAAAPTPAVPIAIAAPPIQTPPPKIAAPNAKTGDLSPEFGSPLTEESWDLLDQLEFQASQRLATEVRTSQAESPGTVLALTPRPAPSSSAPSEEANPCDESKPEGKVSSSLASSLTNKGYARCSVQGVDRDDLTRMLMLSLLDEANQVVNAILTDEWFDLPVEAGDIVNVIITERDSEGYFMSKAGSLRTIQEPLKRIIINSEQNAIIVHPDILVSPTSVTTSFGCLRRAILRETLNVTRPTHQKAFLGTLKHDLFERTLVKRIFDPSAMRIEAQQIVHSNITGLYECGLTEQTALQELNKVTNDYGTWFNEAVNGLGALLNESPPNAGDRVRVNQVLATEEMMWSTKWGLKGATDASVMASFVSPNQMSSQGIENSIVTPLELKTGSKVYAGVEHMGQVILYTLLLTERYQQMCRDGLLMYAPGIESNRIAALAVHVRGLVMARNHFASSLARAKATGNSTSTQEYPPMLRMRRDCERCFQVDECLLHHAAVEAGDAESSGLEEFFTGKTGHLSEADFAYFKKWNYLVNLEQQHAERNLRSLWLQAGWKREKEHESETCIADLQLVSDDPAPSEAQGRRTLRFRRHPRRRPGVDSVRPFEEVRFRVDERVILSAEAYDGSAVLVHIARAKVTAIDRNFITVDAFQSVPTIVKTGQSSVGRDYTWRLDKDAIMSGLARAKENLVRLFIGPSPESMAAGTCISNRPELYSKVTSAMISTEIADQGDVRRRNAIVHLSPPQFTSHRVSDLVKRRYGSLGSQEAIAQGNALMAEFFQLNVDQQRAVHCVLNTLDYALILGMPGTGKTSTIAFTVRILLYLGFSVLVTSYTHSAVDNLLLKLLKHSIPMLRVGNTTQVHPSLADYTLDQQTKDGRIASVSGMEASIMRAQLVGCTCLSVNTNVVFMKRRFDFCIVDEATQITQPVVLGALRCADSFVLVGDHHQLPPLVANPQARKEGMDESLFRRLTEAHSSATQQLTFQYRMNSDIMMVANRLVYSDKLKCGSTKVSSNHLKIRWEGASSPSISSSWPVSVLSNDRGVVFLDTDRIREAKESAPQNSGQDFGNGGRRRMENKVEAEVMVGLVRLLVMGGVSADEIAVISPFRAQVARIHRELSASIYQSRCSPLQRVEVSTIDKYQGKDKDVVLVSFVRSNAEGRVGELLTDWRRINVALTRAKQKLLLVGSLSTLRGGSDLFRVLAELVERQQWRVELHESHISVLKRVADDVSAQFQDQEAQLAPSQPEPEAEQEVRDFQPRVSVMIGPRHDSGDIESLVPGEREIRNSSRPPRSLKRVFRGMQ